MAQLKRLYLETVSATNKPAMSGLLALMGSRQLLFGTDTPYVGIDETVQELTGIGLDAAVLADIERANALRLMPQLAR